MATPEQKQQTQNQQRSDNLLPADTDADADAETDGRYDVAEEVNMDQQSDAARRVGKPPKGMAAEALADALVDKDAPKGDKA